MKEKILKELQAGYEKNKHKLKKAPGEESEEEFVPSDEGEEMVKAPKYDIVYSYPVELGDYWNDDGPIEKRKRPKSFTIKVSLPKVKKVKDITKLEINQKEFILDVKNKYYLDIKMPLPVLSE